MYIVFGVYSVSRNWFWQVDIIRKFDYPVFKIVREIRFEYAKNWTKMVIVFVFEDLSL